MSTRLRVPLCAMVVLAVFAIWGPAPAAPADRSPNAWDIAVLDRLLASSHGRLVAVGDMRYKRSTIVAARERLVHPGIETTAASSSGVTFWPSGVVPVTFDGTVTAGHRQMVIDALAEWTGFANLTFIPRTNQGNYVTFHEDPNIVGGNSTVGSIGGQQFVNIGPNSWNRYTLMHETGHMLGFEHEHQRSDRDTFVSILTANIIPGDEPNFAKITTSINYGNYDFLSVMHYARNTLSVDPATKNTIEPKPGFEYQLDEIGTQFDRPLSTGDRAAIATIYGAPTPAPSAVVANTRDSGRGSLRNTLEYTFDQSENTATTTTVTFNIPAADPGFDGTTFTIRPTAQLPALGNNVVVDGNSQAFFTGNTNVNGPEIVLNGSLVDSTQEFASGLVMRGFGSKVKGLNIRGFNDYGVKLTRDTAVLNVVTNCYIGTDATGTVAAPNAFAGVEIEQGAFSNTIGGSIFGRNIISGNELNGVKITGAGTMANTVAGNLIGLSRTNTALPNGASGVGIFGGSGNVVGGTSGSLANTVSGNGQEGVVIDGATAQGNVVRGNFIGTDPTGAAARPNGNNGVSISRGAKSNVVGGNVTGAGNVISGNAFHGVAVGQPGTNSNVVQGNLVGLAANGTADLGNGGAGILVYGGALSTQVGGTAAAAANTVSGNVAGIQVGDPGTNGTKVVGNRIGTNKAGTGAVPNDNGGVDLFEGAKSTVVGGTSSGAGNLISGNGGSGITMGGVGTTLNVLQGNRIGTNQAGTAALANGEHGIVIFDRPTSNTIGGTSAAAANTVSGNTFSGIFITGLGTTSNKVQGNRIGVNAAGTAVLPNGGDGVAIFDRAATNTIGGTGSGAGNVIGGNSQFGVVLAGGPTGNLVQGNRIGILAGGGAAPNAQGGVLLAEDPKNNKIGGTGAGAGNIITGNGGPGVVLTDAATTGNSIRRNSISGNSQLGIDLGSTGVTPNDTKDPDNGPNKLQNYPVLSTPTISGGNTTIKGTLNSKPSTTFQIEIFTSPSADPSLFGEGANYLTTVTVTTNASGNASFTYTTDLAHGLVVTTTASDGAGNTSEFSKRVVTP